MDGSHVDFARKSGGRYGSAGCRLCVASQVRIRSTLQSRQLLRPWWPRGRISCVYMVLRIGTLLLPSGALKS